MPLKEGKYHWLKTVWAMSEDWAKLYKYFARLKKKKKDHIFESLHQFCISCSLAESPSGPQHSTAQATTASFLLCTLLLFLLFYLLTFEATSGSISYSLTASRYSRILCSQVVKSLPPSSGSLFLANYLPTASFQIDSFNPSLVICSVSQIPTSCFSTLSPEPWNEAVERFIKTKKQESQWTAVWHTTRLNMPAQVWTWSSNLWVDCLCPAVALHLPGRLWLSLVFPS